MRTYFRYTLTIVTLMLVYACAPVNDDSLMTESGSGTHKLNLRFSIMHDGYLVKCKAGRLGFTNIGETKQDPVSIETFAFYLHQLRLRFTGTSEPILFNMLNNYWQYDGTALISAANVCDEKNIEKSAESTSDMGEKSLSNYVVSSMIDEHAFSTLSNRMSTAKSQTEQETSRTSLNFLIGVPFLQNHANPLTQSSPLNIASMFWSWQMGYKFMRVDLRSSTDSFAFHLGSTGCQSASRVRAPASECEQPNRVPISLDLKPEHIGITENEVTINIAIQVDQLLNGITISRENACMFAGIDQQKQCAHFLQSLAHQKVFKAI
ncbi:MbnP family copper-binding protein [Glaciecola sp. KUL10]|uniref:MbnP family copper-binding protein n=1 Tax=Glaciecola sp. (strain KUL10) TaxID=2161813 RepID=UPI0018F5C48C|nr:MbnP family copper-binding protein [Glaciecola sp. KUL10]